MIRPLLSPWVPTGRAKNALLALGLGTALAVCPIPFAPNANAAAANATPGSLAEKLPSFAPIVDRVVPAVVNISVVQKAGAARPDDQGDGEDDEDEAPTPRRNPHSGPGGPGFPQPGPGGTPFDDFLRRFFEFDQQQRRGAAPPQGGQRAMALGSGFIIDASGYVVTNNHVVGDAEKVTVIFADDTRHPAKIIGKDPRTDLAVLKIDAPQPLPFVKFGDSDTAKVGDWVIAVGNPFGLGGTVTKGIISARGRPIADSSYVDYLQIDASINRGNSGGPTFDLDGNVIGINTAIYSPNGGSVGIGFAIPSNTAKSVIEQLKTSGQVSRGWLGVQIQEVTAEIASSLGLDHPAGALVAAVVDNSPAAKAGVKVGDLIQKFDGKPVEKSRDLSRYVAETTIGKKADLQLLHEGKPATLQVAIEKLDEGKVASRTDNADDQDDKANKLTALGVSVTSLTADARKRLNVPKDVQGVLVSRVKAGSPAAERGLEAGDVIVQVNSQPVAKPEDIATLLKPTPQPGKAVLLLISRRGQNVFIAIPPEEKKG